jgi:hypothetical protein
VINRPAVLPVQAPIPFRPREQPMPLAA